MSEMQQKIVEMLDKGCRVDTVISALGCSRAYVSFLKRGKRGRAKYLTLALKDTIDEAWLRQDKSAGEIAAQTGLALNKVIAYVLELEQREAAKCRA